MDEKKVREAIEELKSNIQTCKVVIVYAKDKGMKATCERQEVKIQVYETAIEALEKQLSKKPNEVKNAYTPKIGEFMVGKCPNCGNEVSDRFDSCLECRQKLDWSE